MVTMQPKTKTYNQQELKAALSKHTSKDSEVMFAGVYESSEKDQSIELILGKHEKPIVLVLSSYDAVNWKIKNTKNIKIEAIIYSAYKPGVEVKGDLLKSVPILAYKGRVGSYDMKRRCSCINGGANFHCEGSSAEETINRVESLTGKKMVGFSGKYGTDALLVPNVLITEKKKKEFKADKLKIEKQRAECGRKSNPEFEKMFE